MVSCVLHTCAEKNACFVTVSKLGSMVRRAANEERVGLVTLAAVDRDCRAAVNAHPHRCFKLGKIVAEAFDHLAKCRRERDCLADALRFAFSPFRREHDSMEA